MNPLIFREYDIRGVAERDLPPELVRDLGRALGTLLGRAAPGSPSAPDAQPSVALGRDCRLDSPRLREALLEGLLESGLLVLDLGVVPTPLLYFAVFHLDAGGGVQITGSHNPPADNGFKILRGTSSLHGTELQRLREMIERRDFDARPGGRLREVAVREAYQEFVLARLRLGPRRFPIVVDGGNGTGGAVAAPLFASLGFPTTRLYCEMDGRFPNHHPDPTVPENVADLRRAVAASGAEVGLGFDGDADRLGVVDRRGRIIWGDQLLILFARAILEEEPGATFVSEVKCSKALYDEIARAGGKAIMWRVGHSRIKEKMKEVGALLGGEMSGHIFFAHRYLGYDDAIYAGARLLELLSRSPRTLAEHVDSLPRFFNTPELRRAVPDTLKFEIVRRAVRHFRAQAGLEVLDLDGARVHWPDAWALLRASNTQPALVLRFEAQTPERLLQVRVEVEAVLAALEAEVAAGNGGPR